MNVFIILPHQLYENISNLEGNVVYIIEDPYYFNPSYHKQKLVLHHASMNYYYDYLKNNKIKVEYIEYDKCDYSMFKGNKYNVKMYNPIDHQSIKNWKHSNVTFLDPYNFICTSKDLDTYKSLHKKVKKYTHSSFYKWQRSRLNILMNKDKPLYDKLSFDTENRSKFSSNYKEPKIISFNNEYISNAKKYVLQNYPKGFGYLDNFNYPIDPDGAKKILNQFISEKIDNFGVVQDAMSKSVVYGNHSILSSSLNIGIITPEYVINRVIKYFNNSSNKRKIMSSVEGFIRQIIGWREYLRYMYTYHYSDILKINLPLINKLPISWYNGNTELNILNHYIEKVKKYAFLHHTERLMIVNNLAILYQINYKSIYKWFMTCFIDSYDWVMIPNVMMNYNSLNKNMSFMTRVYLCSYNYISKMSDFKDNSDAKIINELYTKFLKKNKTLLSKDYMLAGQIKKLK